jgi:hypothetical protein
MGNGVTGPDELTSIDNLRLFRVVVLKDHEVKPRPDPFLGVADASLMMRRRQETNIFKTFDKIRIESLNIQ